MNCLEDDIATALRRINLTAPNLDCVIITPKQTVTLIQINIHSSQYLPLEEFSCTPCSYRYCSDCSALIFFLDALAASTLANRLMRQFISISACVFALFVSFLPRLGALNHVLIAGRRFCNAATAAKAHIIINHFIAQKQRHLLGTIKCLTMLLFLFTHWFYCFAVSMMS